MYESYEELMEQKLAQISDKRDKRQGSLIYDALAPNAAETAAFYADLSFLEDRTYADTATGIDLTRRCAERGIHRKEATKAVFLGKLEKEDGQGFAAEVGSRFALEENTYVLTEMMADGNCKLECETAGEAGNAYLGNLLPLTYMEGLAVAKLVELLEEGADEEDDETLRSRYMDSLQADAFGGNIADYKLRIGALEHVGGVKVYPVYYGGGTVRLVIQARDWKSPTEMVLQELQNEIDPDESGTGMGIAPIGHKVTVEGVQEKGIQLKITYTAAEGADSIEDKVQEVLEAYLLELRKAWAENDHLTVRKSQVESRVLDIDGVIDVSLCQLNGQDGNLILEADEIPVVEGIEAV